MNFWDQVTIFLKNAQEKAKDGLAFAEIVQLFFDLIKLAVTAANSLQNSGEDKKALVEAAVAQLYDHLAPYIPLPMLLQPFRIFIAPTIRQIVLAVADGTIEWVYAQISAGNLKPADPIVIPATK